MIHPSHTTTVSVYHGGSVPVLLKIGVAVLLLLVYACEATSTQARLEASDPRSSGSHVFVGKVVKVIDGDTMYALDETLTEHKVRLAGIDAPERNQPYGLASRKHLGSLVAGKIVKIEYTKHDRYDRIVGKVWVDGVDAGLEQIEAGLAWHYKKYQNEQDPGDRVLYAQAENRARTERMGLWRDRNPRPPWEFRRLYRSQASEKQRLAHVLSVVHEIELTPVG